MSVKQHIVTLRPEERQGLLSLIGGGVAPARKLARARVLLKADTAVQGARLSDEAIAAALEVSARTVARVRADFAAGGMERALSRRAPNRVYPRCFDADAEAKLIALACSPPPDGRARWSVRLLAAEAVQVELVEHTCPETVRTTLKKTTSSRG
jgi:hypothetical protein